MASYKIFYDGKMIPAGPRQLAVLTPGTMKGRGVFETVLAHGGKIFLLEEHLHRMEAGLRQLRIKSPYPRAGIRKAIQAVLSANRLRHARIRLTVWKEKGETHAVVIARPYRFLSAARYRRGFKAMIYPAKLNEHAPSVGIKSIEYSFFLKAYAAAKKLKCDEAIILNRRGQLVEGSRTNVFWIKGGTLFTPAKRCGCLPGITRAEVLRLARRMKIFAREIAADPERFVHADEAFVTNSLLGIMPLTRLNGKKIGTGQPGRLTRRIASQYRRWMGSDSFQN